MEKETTLFLDNVMIRETGLYTLLGSKPMTSFNITEVPDISEEGLQQSYNEIKEIFRRVAAGDKSITIMRGSLPDYKTHKEKSIRAYNELPFLRHKELWEAWLAKEFPLNNEKYKLVAREGHYMAGLFINVPHMVHILTKHQKEFTEITKIAFDPNKIIDSISEKESPFWDVVFKNHYLHGLLLGYGEKNAMLFDWIRKNALSLQELAQSRFNAIAESPYIKAHLKKEVTIEDLAVPPFATFAVYDPQVEKYEKEREKIIAFLKDKDFYSFVMMLLCRKE